MSSTAQATKNELTRRGSTQIVTEFFGYSINNILYQRGIYPPETFARVAKYGLTMMVTKDDGLKTYLAQVLEQLSSWLTGGEVQKLVLVITGVQTSEVLERARRRANGGQPAASSWSSPPASPLPRPSPSWASGRRRCCTSASPTAAARS